jgi:hypothetical protein
MFLIRRQTHKSGVSTLGAALHLSIREIISIPFFALTSKCLTAYKQCFAGMISTTVSGYRMSYDHVVC